MKSWKTYYYGYLRITYNLIVVSLCSFIYWRCIVTIRGSRFNKRVKLLTFAFAGNLISWFTTVLPHLLFFDFILKGEQITLPHLFLVKYFQFYIINVINVGFLWESDLLAHGKGLLLQILLSSDF